MPAIAAIAINDGKATPVTHTFSPNGKDGTAVQWANRAVSLLSGQELLTIEVVRPKNPKSAARVLFTMYRPVVAVVDGVDTVVRYSKETATLNFPQDGTAADRKDSIVLWTNLFTNASVRACVENLEPFYGS